VHQKICETAAVSQLVTQYERKKQLRKVMEEMTIFCSQTQIRYSCKYLKKSHQLFTVKNVYRDKGHPR
jgi:hypothetical protein